jgi:DNA-binding NtrC family response regulator
MAKILIADDQDMMRDSLAATLAREGHDVVATTDGPIAVSKLSQQRFDLLITDLKMPKMTGIELLAEAKKLRPDMPVVLDDRVRDGADGRRGDEAGGVRLHPEAFDGEEIKMLVERTLEHSRLKLENQPFAAWPAS